MASICVKSTGGNACRAICLALCQAAPAAVIRRSSYDGLKALEHGDWQTAVENCKPLCTPLTIRRV